MPGVVDLTPDNFDQFVNGSKSALVEFYAPWCGHCKQLVPAYTKLGEEISGNGALKSQVVIGKVNADAHRELGQRFGIRGFPTIKWFGRGNKVDSPDDYEGGRSADQFLNFIKDKVQADKGLGRVASIDEIIMSSSLSSSSSIDKDIIEKLEAAVSKAMTESTSQDESENLGIYMKVVKKLKSTGTPYITSESARLTRMIETGNVPESKIAEMLKKMNILEAFGGSQSKSEEDADADDGSESEL